MPTTNARLLLLLLVLSLSLNGCAVKSLAPPAPVPIVIPPPPVELMQEPLNGSYSDSVQQLLLEWRKTLTDWRRRS